MKRLEIPKSGRRGDYVYYMRGKNLCRRRYVVPRNVRTAARRRARRAFGGMSKAWGGWLTEEQRQAWCVAAAKVRSRPRLSQSGPLTGEMHFEGINSARARIGAPMLAWPPERVLFGPNPVEGLSITYVNGQPRLRIRVSGPVPDDIMVFGQAPCSAGRKKWRHGAYLCLLRAPIDGEFDITDSYVEKYGLPEPGQRVFIRTRQQRDGWEGRNRDCSALVAALLDVILAPPNRTVNKKGTRKPSWKVDSPRGTSLRGVRTSARLNRPQIPERSPATSASYAMQKGVVPDQHRISSLSTPVQRRRRTGGTKGIRKESGSKGKRVLGAVRRKRRPH